MSRLSLILGSIWRHRWPLVGFVVTAILLNLYPYGDPFLGLISRGWPWEYQFQFGIHFGYLAWNVCVLLVMASVGLIWLELRSSSTMNPLQFRLVDIFFGLALASFALSLVVHRQWERMAQQEAAALLKSHLSSEAGRFSCSRPLWLPGEKPFLSGSVICWLIGWSGESDEQADAACQHVEAFRHLQRLHLDREVSCRATERLQRLPNLHYLEIKIGDSPRQHLVNIAQIPNLHYLHIDCKTLTDDDLRPLTVTPRLRWLVVRAGPQFEGRRLSELQRLEFLGIEACRWNPETFQQIGKLKNLVKLTCSNIVPEDDVTLADWNRIGQLKKLRVCQLDNCSAMTTEWLDVFHHHRELKAVSFSGAMVNDDIFLASTKLPNGIDVHFDFSEKISGDALARIIDKAKSTPLPFIQFGGSVHSKFKYYKEVRDLENTQLHYRLYVQKKSK